MKACAILLLILAFVPLLAVEEKPPGNGLSERVLVTFNANSRQSKQVADYYMKARGIPAVNQCPLKLPAAGSNHGNAWIAWEQLEPAIKAPIRKCLEKIGKSKILYIVFTYDTPYKLYPAPAGFGAAIDSHVADLWDELSGAGRALNPYYANAKAQANAYPPARTLAEFRGAPGAATIYSVWRLDAATAELAKGLADKAIAAEAKGATGQACFDRRYDLKTQKDVSYGSAEWQLHRAAEFARQARLEVLEDDSPAEFGTAPAPARCDNALLYAGWYALNHYNDAFSWSLGAVGLHLDSASAADPRGGTNWSANAIKRGITVTAGAVAEPTLPGLPRPDGVVRDLLGGATVGDALLRHTLWLKWMILNIGDPLYRPFARGARR